MIIEICSLARAVELAETAREKTSILSITSKEEKDVVFSDNPNILSVLRLKFNDLPAEYDEDGRPYGRPLPRQEDLAGLMVFADGLQCRYLIVHCWEGTSRSAAVAKAIYEYREGTDEIRAQKGVSPNPLVYGFACRELGI